jgi:O-antigen ligase
MRASAPTAVAPALPLALPSPLAGKEARWSVAFLGMLFYLVVEYTRLPVMFPFLLEFQIGKVAVLLTLVGFVFAARQSSEARADSRSLDLGVLTFILISLVSAVLARNSEMAWKLFADIGRWGIIYFLISRVVVSRWRVHVFIGLFLLLNLKLAQFQIRSYFGQKAWGRSDEFLARGVGVGSVGFFANSNDFGVAMCAVWPLAGILVFGESKKYMRLFMLITFTVFTAALLLSGSRGALVGAAATAIATVILHRRTLVGPMMAVLLIAGVIYLLPDANKERIRMATDPDRDHNVATRLRLWQMGLRMYAESPVLGVGPGNYRAEYLRYDPSKGGDIRRVLLPHSIYIQALSELGTLGFLAFVWVAIKAWRMNVATARRVQVEGKGRQPLEWFFARGLNLALVGYLVSGAFLTVLYYPHLWFLIGISAGLSVATAQAAAKTLPAAAPPAPVMAAAPASLPAPSGFAHQVRMGERDSWSA